MSAYVSFECARHGFVDVDTSSVGCPECETEFVRRKVIEGQIAVLEEMQEYMRHQYESHDNPNGSYCNTESDWMGEKIAALRKGLGE